MGSSKRKLQTRLAGAGRRSARPFALTLMAVLAAHAAASSSPAQSAWDPNTIRYETAPDWQVAAAAAINRHLPTDSGYWVLGPIDLSVTLPDTMDLVRTTLRVLAPDPAGSRSLSRRLWVPTGGVALEELQPADTLPHELPPGYPGRFLKGTVVGERVYVQALTIQEHRWLLWAQRVELTRVRDRVAGPIARFSESLTRHLAAVDSGARTSGPPRAGDYGLDPTFDFYARTPEPVIRDRSGYLGLLERNRAFTLDDQVRNVVGVVPGAELATWLESHADSLLFPNRDGEVALQHRYRDYRAAGGRWSGRPVLNTATLAGLRPGRYAYIVDRFGFMRIGPKGRGDVAEMTCAMLAHNDPVRVAGELTLAADSAGTPTVRELNVFSEDYFFSNRSLTLYPDVEERSDRYVLALGHALRALDQARVPRDEVLLRKF